MARSTHTTAKWARFSLGGERSGRAWQENVPAVKRGCCCGYNLWNSSLTKDYLHITTIPVRSFCLFLLALHWFCWIDFCFYSGSTLSMGLPSINFIIKGMLSASPKTTKVVWVSEGHLVSTAWFLEASEKAKICRLQHSHITLSMRVLEWNPHR